MQGVMNDKVNELVEWVSDIIREATNERAIEGNRYCGLDNRFAKQILSHPDLALIDKEAPLIKVDEDYSCYLHSGNRELLLVIPLAEALKERE